MTHVSVDALRQVVACDVVVDSGARVPAGASLRFSSLTAAIAVVDDARIRFAHLVEWNCGLVRSITTVWPPGATTFDPDVAVSMSWDGYIGWRCGERGIAEAASSTGTVEGPFPALALGEGLVETADFLSLVPRLPRPRLAVLGQAVGWA